MNPIWNSNMSLKRRGFRVIFVIILLITSRISKDTNWPTLKKRILYAASVRKVLDKKVIFINTLNQFTGKKHISVKFAKSHFPIKVTCKSMFVQSIKSRKLIFVANVEDHLEIHPISVNTSVFTQGRSYSIVNTVQSYLQIHLIWKNTKLVSTLKIFLISAVFVKKVLWDFLD